MFIISSGENFNDIDAFACAIAYAELLQKEGKEARAVFLAPLNHSITPFAREQNMEYVVAYTVKPEDQIVYVDVSDPMHLAFGEKHASQVVELYDHYYGWEEYWQSRLARHAHIERVGAAATLIWEEYQKRGYADTISQGSANLLALGILQNTLNFSSSETTERDSRALEGILSHASLQPGWREQYFADCAVAMDVSFDEVLRNDTKTVDSLSEDRPLVFSQVEITENPEAFLSRHRKEIDTYWRTVVSWKCLMNIADMSTKTSLLYSDDPQWLLGAVADLFPEVHSRSSFSIRLPLYQRKQIIKILRQGGMLS